MFLANMFSWYLMAICSYFEDGKDVVYLICTIIFEFNHITQYSFTQGAG